MLDIHLALIVSISGRLYFVFWKVDMVFGMIYLEFVIMCLVFRIMYLVFGNDICVIWNVVSPPVLHICERSIHPS